MKALRLLVIVIVVGALGGGVVWYIVNRTATQTTNTIGNIERESMSALHKAAQDGDVATLRTLIADGADPDRALRGTVGSGRTPLMVARDAATVDALLEAGAGLGETDAEGFTALMCQAQDGHADAVAALVKAGASVNVFDNGGTWSPLHLAAQQGEPGAVRALLDAGAEVDPVWVPQGRTLTQLSPSPLHLAARNGHLEVVRMLLDAGADISCRTSPSPALQAAATGGHREIAKLLLARGADVNEQRDRGLSALMAAARAGKLELVRELIAAGADVNASTEDGQTALLVASDVDVAIVDALLGAGADVNVQRSSDGMNALMVAALAEKTDIVKRLLDAGIDRARPNDFNETAAQLARTRGTPTGDAIAKLIEAK